MTKQTKLTIALTVSEQRRKGDGVIETFSEYAERILNDRFKPLPTPKGKSGKFILPPNYRRTLGKRKEYSESEQKKRQELEEAEMFYEYILESKKLRAWMIVYLIDEHADMISRASWILLPYVRKSIYLESSFEYTQKRKDKVLAPECPFPCKLPDSVAGNCSIMTRSRLSQLDEEFLVNGLRYKECLEKLPDVGYDSLAERIAQLHPDHIGFADGYLKDGSINYENEVPRVMRDSTLGGENWIPLPLWIDANASAGQIKKEFNNLIDAFYDIRKNKGMEVHQKAKSGNKAAGFMLPSPLKALNSLRMWRIRQIMKSERKLNWPIDSVFECKNCGITSRELDKEAEIAQKCFDALESGMVSQ